MLFADPGLADAEERQTKLRLAHALNAVLDEHHPLTQAGGRRAAEDHPSPKISALRNYKLERFSAERLITLITALGRDVEIVIRKTPKSRATARINVGGGVRKP